MKMKEALEIIGEKHGYAISFEEIAGLFLLAATLAQAQVDVSKNAVSDIFTNKCAFSGCHAGNKPANNLDLSAEVFTANLVKVKSASAPQFLRVKPGDLAGSYLVRKVMGQSIRGERMPKNAPPLSAGEINAIKQWVLFLPAEIVPTRPARRYTQAFYGWSLGDLPTAETLERGAFLYRITHRFRGTLDTGFGNFFGLDGGAFMLTQLTFPVRDHLNLNFARQGLNATYELGAKFRLLRQRSDGKMPVALALYAGVDWATRGGLPNPTNPNATLRLFAGERFAYFFQTPLSRSFNENFAALFVPSLLCNGNVALNNETTLFAVGLGGKYAFNAKYAFFAQVVPILSGDATAATVNGQRMQGNNFVFRDTFVAGFEMKSGGHVFHIFVTNSAGNSTNQYLSGADLLGSDLRLGFNIYRILNYPAL